MMVLPTLVLDVDDCLVSCHGKADFSVKGYDGVYQVRMRPGLLSFLEKMGQIYSLIVFSSASPPYVSGIVRYLNNRLGLPLISGCFSQTACKPWHDPSVNLEVSVKDLERIIDIDLKRTVWLDDDEYYWLKQPNNGFVVPKFRGTEDEDDVLEGFVPLLTALSKLDDFVPAIEGLRTGECKLVDGELVFGEVDARILLKEYNRKVVRKWLIAKSPKGIRWQRGDEMVSKLKETEKDFSEESWECLKRLMDEENEQLYLEIEANKSGKRKRECEISKAEAEKTLKRIDSCMRSGEFDPELLQEAKERVRKVPKF